MNRVIFDALVIRLACVHLCIGDGYLQNTVMVAILNLQRT